MYISLIYIDATIDSCSALSICILKKPKIVSLGNCTVTEAICAQYQPARQNFQWFGQI